MVIVAKNWLCYYTLNERIAIIFGGGLGDLMPNREDFIRYDIDNETTLIFNWSETDPNHYNLAAAYIGRGGEGIYVQSVMHDDYHIMHVAEYSGGKAHGPYIEYITEYSRGRDTFTLSGELVDGIGHGIVVFEQDGVFLEVGNAEEYWNWLPEWGGQ